LARNTAGAETAELLAEGVGREAVACGDLLLAAAVHANGAEGFVETLGVGAGLEEEAAARMVGHQEVPECDAFARRSRASG
jgi:hypothetical protein